jgi:hypothetical protein
MSTLHHKLIQNKTKNNIKNFSFSSAVKKKQVQRVKVYNFVFTFDDEHFKRKDSKKNLLKNHSPQLNFKLKIFY